MLTKRFVKKLKYKRVKESHLIPNRDFCSVKGPDFVFSIIYGFVLELLLLLQFATGVKDRFIESCCKQDNCTEVQLRKSIKKSKHFDEI